MRRTNGDEGRHGLASRLHVALPVAGLAVAAPLAGTAIPRPAVLPASTAALGATAVALLALAWRVLRDRRAPLWWWLGLAAAADAALAVRAAGADAPVPPGAVGALVSAVALASTFGAAAELRGSERRWWREWAADAATLGLIAALGGLVALREPSAGVGVLVEVGLAGAALGVAIPVVGALRRPLGTRLAPALLLAGTLVRFGGHLVGALRIDGRVTVDAGLPGVAAAAVALPLLALAVLPADAVGVCLGEERARPRLRRTAGRLTPPAVSTVAVVAMLAVGPLRPDTGGRVTIGVLAVSAVALSVARLVRAVTTGDRARRALARAVGHDRLTGLPGRDQVEERLLAALEDRDGRGVAVLLVDVDRFQHVNDTRGHRRGDAVLRELAARLETVAPPHSIVGRTAGDEYTVAALDLKSEEEVLRVAERLLGVFDRPVQVDGEDLFLTGTVGISTNLTRPGTPVHDLFREADTALHRAKVETRGAATVFDTGMRVAVERRVETEMQLRGAIDRGELTMHYQPVVDITTGVVSGFEALMRWTQPSGRIVGPNAFIAVAEETGLVVPMGSWAIVESLYQLRRWIDAGVCARNVGMAVNLAARQLHDAGLIATVMGALHGAALPPHQLTLEVTETALLSDARDVERTIDRLKSLGVQIALDDFGTGYSSLAHLRRFPIDRIKIDRSFVGNLETSAEDRALVRSIVVMARELGKDVVAEGVETRGQLEVLARIGCAKAQGFLFSEPLPAHAIGKRAATLEPPRRPGTATAV